MPKNAQFYWKEEKVKKAKGYIAFDFIGLMI